ncbi:helix-turn-helix transcriptional regulator [Facklamia sp. 7083-14-GEN3]|uniref:helix-turn-helix domain-containing protein n=1 Tax=Facklamia sp. 7083-14-GEN3 TaxID=2973478 RepID=UPI00215D4A34|nr:helix-turn-helix transcriptional regulator [Facklamia sp. 7083-14-GEN3]MCR8969307.1 helix-turn-helix domain-containing protein [Facklamia sp. 7083-14-GEN3]
MFDRIKILCDKKGISITELAQRMGWADKAIYNWRSSTPSADKVKAVADFFNVSVDYIMNRTDNPKVADSNNDDDFLVAAHIDGDFTEEELEDIKDYIEFIKSKHKK